MEIAAPQRLDQAVAEARTDAKDRLAVALDFPSAVSALAFVYRLEGRCRWFKVGMELFYAAGSGLIHDLREKGFEVFLDLKLHDIPNTVAGAVQSVTSTGASLLTLHASGGERMMLAAVEAAQAPGSPRLLAVTVLTSMDGADLNGTGVASSPRDQAVRLALLAQRCGVAGMVCSPEEVEILRRKLDVGNLLVVPGIRPVGAAIGDQRRIATPGSAIRDGASMLVVGRPITQAADPAQAAAAILAEIEAAGSIS
ncbi:orotidine-5'-phosphate decarboxylase [Granulicella aggregans]|uniref:Orotidine 5'-phosphate decarboxylase n=1 Tax=Granulicella aggregans TaxID=474949 RepID=A0A7W7ZDN2_9BACT|nr:orotidine-5'-phosphate decarboxylase [Granulicella aggregans]MBB5058000.1 orotidine-5'-phosphate decarboxylase [Granulicella aggregans]